jgi:hypothetical protein
MAVIVGKRAGESSYSHAQTGLAPVARYCPIPPIIRCIDCIIISWMLP